MLNKGNKDGKDRQSEETKSHVAVRHALTLQGLWKGKDAQALADTGGIFFERRPPCLDPGASNKTSCYLTTIIYNCS